MRPLESVAAAATATRRLTLWLVAAFGLTSFFLAVVGIYGVMAQAVGQRRQEFGVRQALGATPRDILRLVFSSGAGMTIVGLVVGVALALGSTRLLASLLYGVTPFDPATFAAWPRSCWGRPRARSTFPRAARPGSARPSRFAATRGHTRKSAKADGDGRRRRRRTGRVHMHSEASRLLHGQGQHVLARHGLLLLDERGLRSPSR